MAFTFRQLIQNGYIVFPSRFHAHRNRLQFPLLWRFPVQTDPYLPDLRQPDPVSLYPDVPVHGICRIALTAVAS